MLPVAYILIIWLHFIADFVLQSDRIAKGKSKSNQMLLEHVAIYSVPFAILGIEYAVANACLHFVVDWFSSRATSYLWQKGERHWFFVVIGIDQALHLTCLFVTYEMLA